jgi:hypothetical protein
LTTLISCIIVCANGLYIFYIGIKKSRNHTHKKKIDIFIKQIQASAKTYGYVANAGICKNIWIWSKYRHLQKQGKLITKEKRHELFGKVAGGKRVPCNLKIIRGK